MGTIETQHYRGFLASCMSEFWLRGWFCQGGFSRICHPRANLGLIERHYFSLIGENSWISVKKCFNGKGEFIHSSAFSATMHEKPKKMPILIVRSV